MTAGITTLRSCTRDHLVTTAIDLTCAELEAIAQVIPGEYVIVRTSLQPPSRIDRSRHLLITRPTDQAAALAAIDIALGTFD
jgi:hypothetical protein